MNQLKLHSIFSNEKDHHRKLNLPQLEARYRRLNKDLRRKIVLDGMDTAVEQMVRYVAALLSYETRVHDQWLARQRNNKTLVTGKLNASNSGPKSLCDKSEPYPDGIELGYCHPGEEDPGKE